MTDENLMWLLLGGSEKAFAELHRRFHRLMRKQCVRILRNDADADDAVQAAWQSIFIHRHQFLFSSSVGTWLFRVTHNSALQTLKRRRWLLPLESWQEAIDRPAGLHRLNDPAELFVIKRQDERIRAQLARLGPEHRDLAQRYFIDGKQLQDCAKELGLSEPAAKSRIRLARAQLARRLQM